jgi:RING-like zinc finger
MNNDQGNNADRSAATAVDAAKGNEGGHGFRDCSVCLETLYDPELERKMTFIMPCGHVFHTSCYHTWNMTRFIGGKTLQCATCNGPAARSYYVMDDYNCILCRQSMYASQNAVSFTLPDKRLVHSECWCLFQEHGTSAFHASSWRGVFPSKQPEQFSFRGLPIKQVRRVFLFADDCSDNKGLSVLLNDMAQTLLRANNNTDDDGQAQAATLQQLLEMLTVSELPTVDNLEGILPEVVSSPIRQTVMVAMFQAGMVAAIAKAVLQQQSVDGLSHRSRDFYEKACLVWALLCSNHSGNCAQLVESGGLAAMLFGCSTSIGVSPPLQERPLGLRIALTAFVNSHGTKTTMTEPVVVVSAHGVEAVLAELTMRPNEADVQWAGMTFLAELAGRIKSMAFRNLGLGQSQRLKLLTLLENVEPLFRQAAKLHSNNAAIVEVVVRLLTYLDNGCDSASMKIHRRGSSETL